MAKEANELKLVNDDRRCYLRAAAGKTDRKTHELTEWAENTPVYEGKC